MSELECCPLCRGDAKGPYLSRDGDERVGYNKTYTISCKNCGCNISKTTKKDSNGWAKEGVESVKSRLLRAWNNRGII